MSEMSELVDSLTGVLSWAAGKVGRVSAAQLSLPTPCSEWDVAALLGHMVGGNVMYAMATEGRPLDVALLRGDLLGDDPGAAYEASATRALAGWRSVDPGSTIELPYGSMPAMFSVGTHLMDHLLHGWDLCTATGMPRDAPDELVAAARRIVEGLPPELASAPGVFAAPERETQSMSAFDRLASLAGRKLPAD